MKRPIVWLPLMLALSFILAACASSTVLRFENTTECGAATISLTNNETGNIREYTVAQGDALSVDLEPGVEYHYIVDYQQPPVGFECESKSVTTQLNKGQTLNVSLESVLDPALEATPAGE